MIDAILRHLERKESQEARAPPNRKRSRKLGTGRLGSGTRPGEVWAKEASRRSGAEVQEIAVQAEDGFAPDVMRELERMGHQVELISLRGELRMGYGAAVRIDGGVVRAGGDPRRSGGAAAIR